MLNKEYNVNTARIDNHLITKYKNFTIALNPLSQKTNGTVSVCQEPSKATKGM